MQMAELAHTDIQVSRVAFGCMSTVGSQTYDGIEDAEATRLIHHAMDQGINFFDTAPAYGDGHSEVQLGAALRGRRDQAVVATKASGPKITRDEIMADCEASLSRLETDVIDLYQVHWPRHVVPLEESIRAIEDLGRAGKVRAIGVCNCGPIDLAEAVGTAPISTNQVAYSLLARAPEIEIVPLGLEHGVGLLCYSPLAQGLLTGRYRSPEDVPSGRARTRHFSGGRPEARHGEAGCEVSTFAAIDRLVEIAERVGEPLSQVALAWLLAQPTVTSVLAGGSRPEQITQNAAATEIELSDTDLQELDDATREVKESLGACVDMWVNGARTR